MAEHRKPAVIARNAFRDPRFQNFGELPEDRFEAFLAVPVTSRGRLVGVINVQHREPYEHTRREYEMISTLGFLVGAEIEMARLDIEVSRLSRQLEARKLVERAKGILQRQLRVTEEDASLMLQRQSRERRRSMKEVAEAVIFSDELMRSRTPQV